MEDQERIIKLSERDVLEMMDILKTCDNYLDKLPIGFHDDITAYLRLRVRSLFKVLDTELKNNDE